MRTGTDQNLGLEMARHIVSIAIVVRMQRFRKRCSQDSLPLSHFLYRRFVGLPQIADIKSGIYRRFVGHPQIADIKSGIRAENLRLEKMVQGFEESSIRPVVLLKRLRRRQYDPAIIERTIGLVLGPFTALYRSFLKRCTLTNKAVGTI